MTALGAWPEALARIDAEQGNPAGRRGGRLPVRALQVLRPAGLPAILAPAT
jgi:hypothetical protein